MNHKLKRLSKWLHINGFIKEAEETWDASRLADEIMTDVASYINPSTPIQGGETESPASEAAESEEEASSEPAAEEDINLPHSLEELEQQFSEWSTPGQYRKQKSNFHKIEDGKNNYRSANPIQDVNFFYYLFGKYRIRNIVNLKADSGEGAIVSQIPGLNYLNVPLSSRPPSEGDWARIKALLSSGNTLIHCRHGADRTGLIVARWKIETGLSNQQQAYDESLRYGFKPEDHPGYGPSGADPNRRLREGIFSSRRVQENNS